MCRFYSTLGTMQNDRKRCKTFGNESERWGTMGTFRLVPQRNARHDRKRCGNPSIVPTTSYGTAKRCGNASGTPAERRLKMEILDQILDTVLILLIAYGHVIVFIDTGRMADMSKMSWLEGKTKTPYEKSGVPNQYPTQAELIDGSKSVPSKTDGFMPVDRTMFLSETRAVHAKRGRRVPVIENGVTRYITI